jgi:hypothetical protein
VTKISSFDATSTDPKPAASSFAGQVRGARVHVEVTIPRTAIRGQMRVLSLHEQAAVRYEAREFLLGRKFVEPLNTYREWHEEIAIRTLAVAVRNPHDLDDTLATLEAWSQCDEGQIDPLWQRYKDLQDSLDPLARPTMDEAEYLAMQDAAKKKDASLLMSFGCSKLAAFTISMAGQLPS